MAEMNVNNGGSGEKRNKPKKMSLRVDFTPMVDMNMLLITFFMFCTTLSIPHAMDIVVPTKEVEGKTGNLIPASKTLTLILGEDNKVYYYMGMPDYDDSNSLKVTDFNETGLRNVLLNRNEEVISRALALKQKRVEKKISNKDFKQQMAELRKSDDGIVVVIKPTDASSYRNLVDALDEMQVCNIGKYAIVDIADEDRYLMENYKTHGGLTAQASDK